MAPLRPMAGISPKKALCKLFPPTPAPPFPLRLGPSPAFSLPYLLPLVQCNPMGARYCALLSSGTMAVTGHCTKLLGRGSSFGLPSVNPPKDQSQSSPERLTDLCCFLPPILILFLSPSNSAAVCPPCGHQLPIFHSHLMHVAMLPG